MAKSGSPSSWLLLLTITISLLLSYSEASGPDRKTYIVYMGDKPKANLYTQSLHVGLLGEVVGSDASEALLHSYTRTFNGFVAKLSKEEAQKMRGMEGVVSVFLSKKKQLHTTRSWDFSGVSQHVKRTTVESNIVIGMLDTGVWPEADNFKDDGFGPPPSKWKGSCNGLTNFTCNNKIIGAKHYYLDGKVPKDDIDSPRDTEGHGTHTASTAAGREVSGASLLGLAEGTARGGVPSARLAIYKICWADGCSDADILAAFDDAIADGVDFISLSVGGGFPLNYFDDSIAIGAFHSMKNGILTSNSAGNSGPDPGTITNFSPWSLSVAASTIDRKFVTKVTLGNGKTFEGISINTFILKKDLYPIVYGGDVPNTRQGFDSSESRYCYADSLDKTLVSGKIVLCDSINTGASSITAGAVGTVMQDEGFHDVAFTFELPVSYMDFADGGNISKYINSSRNPMASIAKTTEIKQSAPAVVSFSSRGPNPVTADILKPDLTAPGVDILAAWTLATSITGSPTDNRIEPYNIISGTSMSCPHVSGSAAYVKSFNPSFSPAAIKSALMTTADIMTAVANPEAEFAYGSGHINPVRAANPGLIYDLGETDYVKFLCGQGYNTTTLRLVTGDKSTCTKANNGTVFDLNYPSFALSIPLSTSFKQSFKRTVTNVGSPGSLYRLTLDVPAGLGMKVIPSTLTFKTLGQKQSYVLTVEGTLSTPMASGSLSWDDGVHEARSPIVVYQAGQED